MQKKFTCFNFAESLNDIPFSMFLKKYRKINSIKKVLLKKVPLKLSIIKMFDVEGFIVQLPLTYDIFYDKDEYFIKNILKESTNLMQDENSIIFIYPHELLPYVVDFNVLVTDNKAIPFFFMNQIIEKCIRYTKKPQKDLHFVIIDGADTLSQYCIDLIYKNINYLTIVTNRREYFEDKINEIFKETGLIVELVTESLQKRLESDIIINCSKENNKNFYYFNKQSIIIDFISSSQQIRNIMIKRKDIIVIDSISLKINGELIDTVLAQAAILTDNRILRRWVFHGYSNDMLDKILQAINHYDFSIQVYNHFQQNNECFNV